MLLQCLGNDPLQLAIGGAELIGSPLLNRRQRIRIDAQDEVLGFTFFFSHILIEKPPPAPPKEG